MIQCIIVDDEKKNREALSKMLDQFCPNVKVAGEADCVNEAKDLVNQTNPDLVFLDVEMPGDDGFSLLEQVDNPNFEVIFTTAHAAYAVKAIKFAALDFLLKPINLSELRTAVDKVGNKLEQKQEKEVNPTIDLIKSSKNVKGFEFSKIALPTADGIEICDVSDILRCEADRSYCIFYFRDGNRVMVSRSLGEYEEMLTECNFFRVHKSHMVNLQHIKKYHKGQGGYVTLVDGTEVEVSARKKTELMQVLAKIGM
ncbi:MAG: response regulator transcription factor [Flavobacteriales bacterium]|nr:response regulator transcription factor [Flavobacteriales bacterium]